MSAIEEQLRIEQEYESTETPRRSKWYKKKNRQGQPARKERDKEVKVEERKKEKEV